MFFGWPLIAVAVLTALTLLYIGVSSFVRYVARTRARMGFGTQRAPERPAWPSVDYKGAALFREPRTEEWP